MTSPRSYVLFRRAQWRGCRCGRARRLTLAAAAVVGSRRIVDMGVDARKRADDGTVADLDAAAVVKQRALADGDAVADREVVAVSQLHAVIDFTPSPMWAKMCRPSMQRKRRPSQWFSPIGERSNICQNQSRGLRRRIALAVDVGVMAGLQGHILRIERERQHVSGQLRGERQVQLAPVRTAQVELESWSRTISARRSAELWRDELFVQKLNPAAVDLLASGAGRGAVGTSCACVITNEDTPGQRE